MHWIGHVRWISPDIQAARLPRSFWSSPSIPTGSNINSNLVKEAPEWSAGCSTTYITHNTSHLPPSSLSNLSHFIRSGLHSEAITHLSWWTKLWDSLAKSRRARFSKDLMANNRISEQTKWIPSRPWIGWKRTKLETIGEWWSYLNWLGAFCAKIATSLSSWAPVLEKWEPSPSIIPLVWRKTPGGWASPAWFESLCPFLCAADPHTVSRSRAQTNSLNGITCNW